MQFLKWLCIISIILCVLITPAFICNMSMTGLTTREQSSVFDNFSLANHANNQTQPGATSFWPDLNDALKDAKASGDVLLFTDLIYSMTFGLFIIIVKLRASNLVDNAEFELTFMNDYSVEIKGIPKNGFTDDDLKSYLEKFGGKVIELSYAHYYNGVLTAYKKLGKLNKKIRHLEVKAKIVEDEEIESGKTPSKKYQNKLEKLYIKQMTLKE